MQAGDRVNNYQGGCRGGPCLGQAVGPGYSEGSSISVVLQLLLLGKADQQVWRGALSDTAGGGAEQVYFL